MSTESAEVSGGPPESQDADARGSHCSTVPKKYKVATKSKDKQPVFENVLDRQFSARGPDQAYVADIIYVWTQEGWVYLAIVVDLFARWVVRWSMGSRMKVRLVTDALRMAIW
ncbi:MAG: hypothetical protein NPIRA05_04320 [Nitrospirales bacterium]|nr:MAG: hypothetical protein NPIRA05_04320 [Nitrospirales bacterium]